MSVKKELENIIKSGKSAFHKGVHYTELEEIPSESELSKGDAKQEEEARKSIKAELRRLSDELAMLDDEKAASEAHASKASAKSTESKSSDKEAAPKAEESK